MKFNSYLLKLLSVMLFFSCEKESKLEIITDNYFDMIRPEFTGDEAFKTTSFVEQYWRVVGNSGFNKTVYRIAAKLEEVGYVLESDAKVGDKLTYRIEKTSLKYDTWEPIDASLSIVGESEVLLKHATNRNMMYQSSYSTPKGGVEAEVVHIKDTIDLKTKTIKGKIVFTEMGGRKLINKIFVKGKALGMLTYNNPSYL